MYLDQLYALGVSWLNLYCKRWEMMRRPGRCSRFSSLQFIYRASFGHWPSSGSSVFPCIQYRVVTIRD